MFFFVLLLRARGYLSPLPTLCYCYSSSLHSQRFVRCRTCQGTYDPFLSCLSSTSSSLHTPTAHTHSSWHVSRYATIAKLTRCYCASAKWQSCRARSTTFAPLQLDLDARVAAHTAVEKRWVHAMAQLAEIERLQQVAASKASTSSSCARCERSALRSDASRRSRPLRSDSNQSARRATATLASYAERATAVQGSSSSAAIRRDGTR